MLLIQNAEKSYIVIHYINDECVDAACNAYEDYAECAHCHCYALAASRLECGDNAIVLTDKHCLHYKQIIVERHDCVDQRNKYKHVDCNRTGLKRTHKDEELAEEACKRRNTGKREHSKHHGECKARIGLVESVVVVN